MKKVISFSKNPDHQIKNQWNGYLFEQLLQICKEEHRFRNVSQVGELENYMSDYINDPNNNPEAKKQEHISRDTFNRWKQDGSTGPRSSQTKVLIDELVENIYFMHKLCTREKKEKLFEIYNAAWYYHYNFPLLAEGEEVIRKLIKQTKWKDFNQELNVMNDLLNNIHGKAYDNLKKQYGEDRYLWGLLDLFWKEYHQILIDVGLENTFHAILYGEEILAYNLDDNVVQHVNEVAVQEKYKDVLLKRQACLESFADNLKMLFLGDDL